MMNPSDFRAQPMNSIKRKSEAETVARSIMVILARNGNGWRLLEWDEYKEERCKDGHFTMSEQTYFNDVVMYTETEKTARLFSPTWRDI